MDYFAEKRWKEHIVLSSREFKTAMQNVKKYKEK